MEYLEFVFKASPEQHEPITGWLSTLPFQAFSSSDEGLLAYLEQGDQSPDLIDQVQQIADRFQVNWSSSKMPTVNWNAKWEAGFQAISVRDFCGIRADFHPPFGDAVQYELIINPEMAFGTGHHSTTWLVIDFIRTMSVHSARILDYGCGTGVLGLLCMKMGAKMVDGIDYDILSVENSKKNAEINGLSWNHLAEATLDQYRGSGYDLVLANINRNVILSSLSTLYQKVNPDGIILFSGFYETDLRVMKSELHKTGFRILDQQIRNDWMCLKVQK